MNFIARRPIGRTEVSVTELGFGAAPIGNLYRFVSEAEARQTLEAALGAGIRYFDTAPYYGFGLSERRLGDAVRGRADAIVSSKAGRLLRPAELEETASERFGFRSPMPFEPVFDYSRDGILRSHEASLQRLGLARIDVLYIHDIGPQTHADLDHHYRSQLIDGGGLAALMELRDSGSVSAVGLGVNEIEVCLDLLEEATFDVILLAGRYTLLAQGGLEELFPLCLSAGTSIVIGGPFNSGVLAAGSSQVSYYNYASVPPQVLERVQGLEQVCEAHGVPLAAAALQFPLAHPAVASVIPGFANAAEVQTGLEFFHFPIPGEFWSDLRDSRLIDQRAPVPAQPSAKVAM